MGFCLACAEYSASSSLCRRCRSGLRRGTTNRFGSGLTVSAAFHHSGPARRLVHRLKYEGVVHVSDWLAAHMVRLVPSDARALVPVPRAGTRRLRYGVDPADQLAAALSRRTGLPMRRMLRAPLWWPRHALREPVGRRRPGFRAGGPPMTGAVLVDDVVTSGSTMVAAALAVGGDVWHGLVATSPGTMPSPAQADAGEVAWRYHRT